MNPARLGMLLALAAVSARAAELHGVWRCVRNPDEEAVIYLEPEASRLPPAAAPEPYVMVQKGLRFEPPVLVIPVHARVAFPNLDPLYHNVFSASEAKLFNLGTYGPGQSRSLQFDTPGVVEVLCHLHPEMHGIILVVPTRWYTWTRNRNFSLVNVPEGRYRIRYWSQNCGQGLLRSLRLDASASVDLRFTVPEPAHREDG